MGILPMGRLPDRGCLKETGGGRLMETNGDCLMETHGETVNSSSVSAAILYGTRIADSMTSGEKMKEQTETDGHSPIHPSINPSIHQPIHPFSVPHYSEHFCGLTPLMAPTAASFKSCTFWFLCVLPVLLNILSALSV